MNSYKPYKKNPNVIQREFVNKKNQMSIFVKVIVINGKILQ